MSRKSEGRRGIPHSAPFVAFSMIGLALLAGRGYAATPVVQGTVTIRGTSTPVVDATVYVYGISLAQVKTDADGRYQISADQYAGSSGRIFVRAQGYWGAATAFSVSASLPVTVNVSLLAGGAVLSGTVRDSSTSQGIDKAIVTLSGPSTSTHVFEIDGVASTISDSSGNYLLDSSKFMETAAAAGISGKLTVSYTAKCTSPPPPGQPCSGTTGYVSPAPVDLNIPTPFPAYKDLTMLPGAGTVLQGKIVDGSGNPISGATVRISGGTLTSEKTSDLAGNYSIDILEYSSRSGVLTIQKTGFWGKNVPFTIDADPSTVDATLTSGGSLLQGTIRDTSNAPISKATVNFQPCRDTCGGDLVFGIANRTRQTDANGFYSFDSSDFLESMNTANAPAFTVDTATDILTAAGHGRPNGAAVRVSTTGTLPSPLSAGTTYFVREKTDNTLKLAATADGAAINITNAGAGTHTLLPVVSGEVAAFGPSQEPGMPPPPAYVSPAPVLVTIAAPFPKTQNITLLPGAGTVLTGTVTRGNSNVRVAGATVQLRGPSKWTTKVTDANGVYSVSGSEFDTTTGKLYASAHDYYGKSADINITTIPTTLNISLKQGGTVLQGIVKDAATSAGIAGAGVQYQGGAYPFTVDAATDVLTANGHGQSNGAAVNVTSTSELPKPLNPLTSYYVINATANTLKLALAPGGPAINITDTGSGTHTLLAATNLVPGALPLKAVTDASGRYAYNSSNFLEEAATGTTGAVTADASPGYLIPSFTNFILTTPFPATKDIFLPPSGFLPPITISSNPVGRSLTVDGNTSSSIQSYNWMPGGTHTLAATSPQTNAGIRSVFTAWSDGGQMSHSVIAPFKAANYVASFKTQYQLVFSANPSGAGTVTATLNPPLSGTLASGDFVDAGASVSISAVGNSGKLFSSFTGDLSGSQTPQNLLMNGPKNVVANFSSNAITTLTSDVNPASIGSMVTLTATIQPASATGIVHFFNGATELGSSSVTGGTAQFFISSLPLGSHTLTAVYDGDNLIQGSTSNAVTQSIVNAGSSIALFSSKSPSVVGDNITFIASISPDTATGTVQFLNGAAVLGTQPLSNGAASLSTSALAVGVHSITAKYSGDANFGSITSPALFQTVNKIATTNTLTSSSNPALFGSPITFTATLAPGAATGNVQFFASGSLIGTVTVAAGVAQLTTSSMAIGTHPVVAVYSGSASYAGSTSNTISQVVNASANLSVSQSASPTPIVAGRRLTYTVVVNNAGPNTATNTQLTDVLPGGVTLASAKSTQGLCTGTTTVVCALGSMSSGAKITVTIIVTANVVGTITNQATVIANEADPNTANNASSLATQVVAK